MKSVFYPTLSWRIRSPDVKKNCLPFSKTSTLDDLGLREARHPSLLPQPRAVKRAHQRVTTGHVCGRSDFAKCMLKSRPVLTAPPKSLFSFTKELLNPHTRNKAASDPHSGKDKQVCKVLSRLSPSCQALGFVSSCYFLCRPHISQKRKRGKRNV